MILWFGIVAAALLLCAVGVYWVFWRVPCRTAALARRIAPALLELEPFFTLLDISGPTAHFLERHGPMLQMDEVRRRARTGRLDVSGLVGRPVASTRWLSHADMLRAIDSAAQHWADGARPKGGQFVFQFADWIGEGYLKSGGEPVRTRIAIVIIRNGAAITAYPLLRPDTLQTSHRSGLQPG